MEAYIDYVSRWDSHKLFGVYSKNFIESPPLERNDLSLNFKADSIGSSVGDSELDTSRMTKEVTK
jgi:hypothetical protein